MRDALIQVKRELGRDAVILKTRKITKRGLLDVLGREQFEITAATKDYDLSANQISPHIAGDWNHRASTKAQTRSAH